MSREFHQIFQDYQELSVRYDAKQEAVWCYFKPSDRPCFSTTLLRESRDFQSSIINYFKSDSVRNEYPVHYLILASQTPGVFNFGGDLDLFVKLITEKNRDELLKYAMACIDICYMNAICYDLPLTTISFVEGSALGGGFESALSSSVLIAEEHAQMGVPEIRFNLFPGMGAFSFIARKAGMKVAELILSQGKIYNARELHEMKIVDVVAEPGKGKEAVDEFIRKHKRFSNGMRAIQTVRQLYNPVTYEELQRITELWVDTALKLTSRDLRTMEKLVQAQTRGSLRSDIKKESRYFVRTRQDRRIEYRNVAFPFEDTSGRLVLFERRKTDRREREDIRSYS